jgi:hypothetical protein
MAKKKKPKKSRQAARSAVPPQQPVVEVAPARRRLASLGRLMGLILKAAPLLALLITYAVYVHPRASCSAPSTVADLLTATFRVTNKSHLLWLKSARAVFAFNHVQLKTPEGLSLTMEGMVLEGVNAFQNLGSIAPSGTIGLTVDPREIARWFVGSGSKDGKITGDASFCIHVVYETIFGKGHQTFGFFHEASSGELRERPCVERVTPAVQRYLNGQSF